MQSVFEAVGGEEGLLRLAHAWHARVMAINGSAQRQKPPSTLPRLY